MTKTKKEIVRSISEQTGLTQLQTKDIVQKTFEAIIETLVRHKRIELRNFGVFQVKKRAARKARNPRTGERVEVAEKYVVTFKPGKMMEECVRELDRAESVETEATPPVATEEASSESVVHSVSASQQPVLESSAPASGSSEQPRAYNTTPTLTPGTAD